MKTLRRKAPKDKITPVRFDAATYEELVKRAQTEDRSVGYIVRQAVAEYLKERKQ